VQTSTPLLLHSYQGLKNQQVSLTRLRLWLDSCPFADIERAAFRERWYPGSQQWHATKDCVRRL